MLNFFRRSPKPTIKLSPLLFVRGDQRDDGTYVYEWRADGIELTLRSKAPVPGHALGWVHADRFELALTPIETVEPAQDWALPEVKVAFFAEVHRP